MSVILKIEPQNYWALLYYWKLNIKGFNNKIKESKKNDESRVLNKEINSRLTSNGEDKSLTICKRLRVIHCLAQRYWVRDDFFKKGGPVFLYIGGEESLNGSIVMSSNMTWEALARKHSALMLALEHRYYGPDSALNTWVHRPTVIN